MILRHASDATKRKYRMLLIAESLVARVIGVKDETVRFQNQIGHGLVDVGRSAESRNVVWGMSTPKLGKRLLTVLVLDGLVDAVLDRPKAEASATTTAPLTDCQEGLAGKGVTPGTGGTNAKG